MLEDQLEIERSSFDQVALDIRQQGESVEGPAAGKQQGPYDRQGPKRHRRQRRRRIEEAAGHGDVMVEVQAPRSRPDDQAQVEQPDPTLSQDSLECAEVAGRQRVEPGSRASGKPETERADHQDGSQDGGGGGGFRRGFP
jgi:hypothetical protein